MHGRTIIRCTLLAVVWGTVCVAAETREPETKKLTLYFPGVSEDLRLLPASEELTGGDAFPLYQKAVDSLPKDLDWEKIKSWRQMPLGQLPLNSVESMLRPLDTSLPLLEQAGKCKRCDWPWSVEGEPALDLTTCRNMVFLLALKARSGLARGDYESCMRTLGTGLALAKHLGTNASVIHLLLGVAVTGVVCGEIEQYIQQPAAPSLEAALRAIPKPLFDENHSELYGMDEESRNKARLVIWRINRHVIALQYIETLRRGAIRTGQWPQSLDELKADLPNDPVSGKPFAYSRLSETQATLGGPLPEGGGPKDSIRYELNLVK